uniref:Uncharacterized protein n=1 Tax=Picea sitchensis TaxID=3332 RepID=A0A6B9XXQ0_PICSI|nr:hypothetical protein Q903MT_gene6772 [Picea sitchensis]
MPGKLNLDLEDPGILNRLSTVCRGLFLPSLDINMGSQRGFMRGA